MNHRFLLLLLLVACQQQPEHLATNHNWPVALGPGSNHASALIGFTPANVSLLRPAWTFSAGDAGPYSQIQCNPIILDGRIYLSSPTLDAICLDAATGKQIWRTSPSQYISNNEIPSSGMGVNRGIVYAPSPQGDRIFISNGPFLFALSAESGEVIPAFGDGGKIDLRTGLRDSAQSLFFVIANSPGVLFDDMLIIGCRVSEGSGAAPGHIRAYDIHSGAERWIFHTIPQPGESHQDSWPEGAWATAGGANAWAGMTVDSARGIVFVPTGSASYDFYGADRVGANLYANCLIALDARTGQRRWHFQFVHHDLLDRDLPAPPNLVTIRRDGKEVPAVAQITKTGHVFVFHRETGEPLFPINEQAVPLSDLPGEQSWPTQPLPSSPPPFARQQVGGIFDHAEGRDSLQVLLGNLRQRSIFEPPSVAGTLVFPGYDGGGEWGGAAYSPWDRLMVVNSSQMAWSLHMIPTGAAAPGNRVYLTNCAACHGADRKGGEFMGKIPALGDLSAKYNTASLQALIRAGKGNMPAFAALKQEELDALTKFLMEEETAGQSADEAPNYVSSGYNRLLDKAGYPAIAPPWGLLTAIDLDHGAIRWQIPLGEYEDLTARGIPPTGTENYGGPLVTASGLTFIAATRDQKIRAFSTASGTLLWEAGLPFGGYATPSMYEVDGKQYLIIACGGGKMGTKSGDAYVAFALPD